MYIQLIRNKPQGNAITGQLYVNGKLFCDTLEHVQYAIPTGFYRVRLTYSPRFQEILPLLDHVIGRTGIRIHAGNTIEHTEGCILVGDEAKGRLGDKERGRGGDEAKGRLGDEARLLSSRKVLNELREYLLNYQKQNGNEEMYIEIIEPDAYPLYDVPYER